MQRHATSDRDILSNARRVPKAPGSSSCRWLHFACRGHEASIHRTCFRTACHEALFWHTAAAKPFGARVALSTDFPCKHKSTAAWLGRLQVMPSNWMLLPWLGLAFKCMRSSFSTSNRHAKATGDEVTASMPGDGVVRQRCISRRHLERSRTTRCTFHVAATTIGSISESDVLGFSWLKGCGPSVAET